MDFSKLSTGDKVIGGSGIALFIFAFFPWFTYDATFITVSQNGWHFFLTGIIPVLLGLIMIAFVISTRLAEVDLPEMPVKHAHLLLGLGVTAAVLVILRLLVGGDDNGSDVLDRTFGLFLAVLAAIGLAVGAFLNAKDEEGLGTGGSGSSSSDTGAPPTPF
jgi:hypothetical protein